MKHLITDSPIKNGTRYSKFDFSLGERLKKNFAYFDVKMFISFALANGLFIL